mmetsp:Transcript_27063/g.23914  ORF Transcript_27063/g.23914 Transcript_27063/m.23914 type:complete len:85 (+) Transcript_27063:148-402(+)
MFKRSILRQRRCVRYDKNFTKDTKEYLLNNEIYKEAELWLVLTKDSIKEFIQFLYIVPDKLDLKFSKIKICNVDKEDELEIRRL